MIETNKELKAFLDSKVELYNRPEFIGSDPIQVPHRFTKKEDIEIAGFFAASLSWGQRKTIISNAIRLMSAMDNSPYQFIQQSSEKDLLRFEGFCHRTFNTIDTLYFIHALRNIYNRPGGLEKVFTEGFSSEHIAKSALQHFHSIFFENDYPERTLKHVSDVSKGSPAKRLNMFLRWMVRFDHHHVDFGLWKGIDPAWLCIPLDLHAGNAARKLNILTRKQNDWKAVEELTAFLRELDPSDPVKYDFALFGLGVFEKFR